MLSTRSHGRIVGAIGLATAFGCAWHCFVNGASARAIALGTAALAAAYRLFTKLYLNDPIAVAEYRAEIDAMPLNGAMRRYAPEHIVAMFGAAYVLYRIEDETGLESFARLLDAYNLGNVEQCLKLRIVPRDVACGMAAKDVAAAGTFGALWQRFDGRLPHVWNLSVFGGAEPLMQLLDAEFEWVDRRGESREISRGAPAPAKSPMPPFRAAVTYAEWTRGHLGVSRAFWVGALKHSDEGESSAFSELLPKGLLALHAEKLIDVAWAQRKFGVELERKRWSLWEAEDKAELRTCLTSELLSSEQVMDIFDAAIPTSAAHADVHTKERNIVCFMEFWEPVIRRDHWLVPRALRTPMWEAKCSHDRAVAHKKHLVSTADAEMSRGVSAAEKRFRDGNISTGDLSEIKRRLHERCEAETSRAVEELREAKTQIHENFAKDVGPKRRCASNRSRAAEQAAAESSPHLKAECKIQ